MSACNHYMKLIFSLLAIMCLVACAGQETETQQPEDMIISVDFLERHLCSRVSPEITVAYAPNVRLVEQGETERFMGGGSWPEDGSGLIPEGALTRHYQGPCPPKNKRTEYAFVIAAMEKENSQPLAVRLYKFVLEHCPIQLGNALTRLCLQRRA